MERGENKSVERDCQDWRSMTKRKEQDKDKNPVWRMKKVWESDREGRKQELMRQMSWWLPAGPPMGGNTRSAVDQQRALLPLIYGGGVPSRVVDGLRWCLQTVQCRGLFEAAGLKYCRAAMRSSWVLPVTWVTIVGFCTMCSGSTALCSVPPAV